ncbi:phosphotransferase family protein [Flavisphingomonas formosensis]|uniref:phosphotransferase family protein n=1 Tax=Flavisphingomonas formosensis TaxID=861534 RepID=UPI0012F8EC5D|nr:phosphotransferase family protein [Sphingomonas formosensis]
MSDLDETALSRWMGSISALPDTPVSIEKFSGGQSNPTYRIDAVEGKYVLRRKPFGPLLPSAHAVEREFELLSALHPTGFPVPRPIALCQDPTVIGSAFYLMEMVEGRTFWDGALPDLSKADRGHCYGAMIDVAARLHSIDPGAICLGSFGRPGNYMQRQVERWTRQYRLSQTDDVPEIEKLIEWLPRTLPEQSGVAIIHGDYRIDNLIFAPETPDVLAVLDWELATLGDPLADFTYLAMCWVLPSDGRAGLAGVDFAESGIPTLDEAVARYCTASGRTDLPDLDWYFAYNLFRAAGIIQGIKRRLIEGNASSSQALETVAKLPIFAQTAWAHARRAGAADV